MRTWKKEKLEIEPPAFRINYLGCMNTMDNLDVILFLLVSILRELRDIFK
tara:strand:+ start:668 stop:817 length:150 start_codon:yes stop_codon:yes gene_type:complete